MNKHLKQVIIIYHPDFINEASCTDKHNEVVKIFNKAFIDECMISKQNTAVQLTAEQKISLIKLLLMLESILTKGLKKLGTIISQKRCVKIKIKKRKAIDTREMVLASYDRG